jgi:hypothetical protein
MIGPFAMLRGEQIADQDGRLSLVKQGYVHYNRNGWMPDPEVERRAIAAHPLLREYLWKSH